MTRESIHVLSIKISAKKTGSLKREAGFNFTLKPASHDCLLNES
jgi:hypothetical protein